MTAATEQITGNCGVCGDPMPPEALPAHLRQMHPDRWEPIDTWPDGAPVIVDRDDLDGKAKR